MAYVDEDMAILNGDDNESLKRRVKTNPTLLPIKRSQTTEQQAGAPAVPQVDVPDSRSGSFGDMAQKPTPPGLTRNAVNQSRTGPVDQPPPERNQSSTNTSDSAGHQSSSTPDNGSRRRMMEFILRSALKPALPPSQPNDARKESAPWSEDIPAARPGPPAPGFDVRPTLRPNRTVPAEPPQIGTGQPSASQIGRGPQPERPDVMPRRSDFQDKPEVGGWKKYLGLGLATLAGPNAGPLAEKILHGQRDAGDRKYGEATKEWEREQGDKEKAAQTDEAQARAWALRHPKPEKPPAPHYQVDDEGELHEITVGQDSKPVDQIVPGSFGKPTPTPKPTFEEQNYAEWSDTQKKAGKPSDRMTFERQLHPKDTNSREEARGDRSYQFHVARVDKLRGPVESRAERISRLEDTLNQGTPQADALIAPELLTVMAGGQGSGLRMNEAEIARVIGGRTNWETLKAKLGAWQTDPNKGFALTPAQREQTRALFGVIKDRVSKKMGIIDEESEALSGTDSAAEHRRIYNRLQKRLSDIDAGGGQGGQVIVTDPNGGQHTFPDQASADRFKKLAKIQ